MNKLGFSVLALLLASAGPFSKAETYVCQVLEKDQTLTFGFLESLPDEEDWDRVAKFKLSLQTTELAFPDHVEYGIAKEGDVNFYYKSDTSDIEFHMYLDENEPVRFTFNGESLSFADCRYYDFDQKP